MFRIVIFQTLPILRWKIHIWILIRRRWMQSVCCFFMVFIRIYGAQEWKLAQMGMLVLFNWTLTQKVLLIYQIQLILVRNSFFGKEILSEPVIDFLVYFLSLYRKLFSNFPVISIKTIGLNLHWSSWKCFRAIELTIFAIWRLNVLDFDQ